MEIKSKRRVFGAATLVVIVLVIVLVVVLTGASPNGDKEPVWSSTPEIYFVLPSVIERDANFSVKVNISEVEVLWGAQFDIRYDYNVMTYVSADKGAVNGTPPDGLLAYLVGSGPDGEGLLRVLTKWDDYAEDHGGYGVNGSGSICELVFHAGPDMASTQLGFVEGQGDPPGELKIMRQYQGKTYELQIIQDDE
jgi:hypothetical protein